MWIAGILGLFISYLTFNGGDMILYALTNAWNGDWEIPDTSKCTAPDFDEFSAKLIQTPRVKVKSFEECLLYGEAMDHPLICQIDAEISNSEKIVEAILADDTVYNTICNGEGDFHYPASRSERNQTIGEVVSNPSDCGAGFIYGGKHQRLLHSAIPSLESEFESDQILQLLKKKQGSPVMFGTSFISNYPTNRISTGSHAAMIISLAVQLVGTKKWILHHHDESDNKYWYKTVWTMFPGCVADYLKNLKKPYSAVTGPGDVLYFPLAYQHLVYTEKGVNVMTNIRKARLPKPSEMFGRFSLKTMITLAAVQLFSGKDKANNPREATYSHMHVFNSRCKKAVYPTEKEYINSFVSYLEDL